MRHIDRQVIARLATGVIGFAVIALIAATLGYATDDGEPTDVSRFAIYGWVVLLVSPLGLVPGLFHVIAHRATTTAGRGWMLFLAVIAWIAGLVVGFVVYIVVALTVNPTECH